MKAIDLQVQQAGFIAIVGPSGCGKSMCMKLATRLVMPSKSRIQHVRQHLLRPDPRTQMLLLDEPFGALNTSTHEELWCTRATDRPGSAST